MVPGEKSTISEAEQEGFLLSRCTHDAYQRFYDEAEHFLVAEEGGEIAGFLLGYASESIREEGTVNKLLQKISLNPSC